ncbi:PrsW family glutamic-type intramembrane protease [Ruminococcus difficilis]|uniref:PrsW family intramembrane metalloprotease n=1 Tax=Ruminococcus difficilis TaxID=2763069 RepID=A0A934TZ76_9FIRM|nr:PrsW family glutamic-type intramembrane protease [Ruminococcus difficilis]MBK6088140.1 PrsW family intramembrane metalloprotease [Ruminococcus difficilis]
MFSSTEIFMVIGLLPAALLLFYIYKMDRIEKEPKGLLVGLFFLGVGATIPTIVVEVLLSILNNGIFFGSFTNEYEYLFVDGKVYLYEFVNNFFGIALVEEGFKWLFMFLLTRKSKSFNCLFDGVVYAAFVSLGFAAAENVMYVFTGGLVTGVLRMITAVPAHCAFSVVMGYFYGKWFINRNAGALEKNLYQNGVIMTTPKGFGEGKFLLLSLVVPMAIHGFYDFCCTFTSYSWVYWVLLFLLLIFLYIVCFRNVYALSKKDAYITYLCMEKVLERYPDTAGYLCRMPEHIVFFTPQVIQTSIMNREPHGVKITANNMYYAHPMPVTRPKPAPQPVYPQPQPIQYGQPMNVPQAQPMQYGQPMNRPQAQPMQYSQPIQYSQPMNRPQAQPMQYGQPMNRPQAQPIQYSQPMNGSQAQPMQYGQPMNAPQAQPMQYGQPMNAPQAQPMQYSQPVNQPQAQSAPYAQPLQTTQPDYSNGGRPVVDEEPYTTQLDNLEPVGGYRRLGGTPTIQFPDQSQNPYYTQQ